MVLINLFKHGNQYCERLTALIYETPPCLVFIPDASKFDVIRFHQ